MGVGALGEIVRAYRKDGVGDDEPVAVVRAGALPGARAVRGTLGTIEARAAEARIGPPALVVVGPPAAETAMRVAPPAPLQGRRILLTSSPRVNASGRRAVYDYGGVPLAVPLLELTPDPDGIRALRAIEAYDLVVLTSPGATDLFRDALRAEQIDLRRVPDVATSGPATTAALAGMGLVPRWAPDRHFGGQGLLECLAAEDLTGRRILRLRSDKAGPTLAEALRARGADVTDGVLYRNTPRALAAADLPPFDAVFLASSSAVAALVALQPPETLRAKDLLPIGRPTAEALRRRGLEPVVVPAEATAQHAITAYAAHALRVRG
jgi:uroporphyrinogen-III synthase